MPNSNLLINLTISGYPNSNANCSYSECPLVPNVHWPSFKNCSLLSPLPIYGLNNITTNLQNALIAFNATTPSIVRCFAVNSEGASNETANIRIYDKAKNMQMEIPPEIVFGSDIDVSCFASRYEFRNSVRIIRSDDKKTGSTGKPMVLG